MSTICGQPQMVSGISATEAGYMMIPMMVGMMGCSIWSGQLVTRTGAYRHFPIIGLIITFGSMFLFHSLTADTPLWKLGAYLFIFGIGLGLTMQILILIVQNTLPLEVVGTATSVNNFFRQIGASIGTALVGGIFVGNLNDLLTERLSAMAAQQPAGQQEIMVETNEVTPALVHQMPDALREIFVSSYNDALTPVFVVLMPLVAAAFALVLFIKHEPLRNTTRILEMEAAE
ncbi:MFS transporter [Corynebacterium sp. 76QC2CO]|nr:MFS transporter [Corynebacterium sp. 76QC2CO]